MISAERFTQLPPPPKRSRLLRMRARLRNPSLLSFHIAKHVATTKSDLDHVVEAQAAVSPALSHPISLFHRISPVASIAVGLIATVAWTALLGYGFFRLVF